MKAISIFDRILTVICLLMVICIFSQQNISGRIVDEEQNPVVNVLVFNISKSLKVYSNHSGYFTIEATDRDEIRFIKEGFYRTDKIVENLFNTQMEVMLLRAETLIPEVEIKYKSSGNLARDSKHFDDSKKVADLKSYVNEYMKSELNEPLPRNTIPKSFQGHDFQAGLIDLIKTLGAAVGLVKKAVSPKITTPNYIETQNFLAKVKEEVNLDIFEKYGMDEERIDHFLAYAEKVNHLSKKYRKNFNAATILSELQSAFVEYSKLNKLSN
ncbi:hypothetical protein [Chryseobacterium sp. RLHN22]|uniref:hypothetical protein n=1 Tax=Chryseobacterium sp. RLHN22 TaxID=3437885 RepID=UPI003D9B4DBB